MTAIAMHGYREGQRLRPAFRLTSAVNTPPGTQSLGSKKGNKTDVTTLPSFFALPL